MSLTITADGTIDAPSFSQWYFNSNVLDGCTNRTLVITNLALTHSGLFSFVLSNHAGTVATSAANLTVYPCALPRSNQATSPAFNGRSLAVAFLGTPGSSYVFQRTVNFADWLPLSTNTAPATGLLIFTDPAPPSDAAIYRVVGQ
jgi:hypothetical protein